MKIAQVVCVYPPSTGGIGTAAHNIQKIIEKEHESFIFTSKTRTDGPEKTKNVFRIKALLKLGHGAVLFSLLWKLKKFDIIYFHYPFFGTAFIILLLKVIYPQKKLFIHYHMDVEHKNIIYKALSLPEKIIERTLFSKSDIIISSSLDYIKSSQIKKIYEKNPEKFKEIPFSVDTKVFKPLEGSKAKDNFVLFVGGLDRAHYFKGVDVLIRAFSKIKSKNTKLMIVGEGDLKEEYKKIAEKLKISDRMVFTGKLNFKDLVKSYQRARALVLPSINKNEAFGIVLIEAMSCKTPVIASNLAGVRSVFENEKSGLLVDPGSSLDLKNKLEKILNNKEMEEKMGEEALILVRKKYSDEVIYKKTLELFE